MNQENQQGKLKISTIISYAFAQGSGYQIMGSIVGAYFMVFLTDTFKVPAFAVSVIMLCASIWDAVNDPMMGAIADHTKTRWGHYRTYFLWVPALLTIVTVAMFASPNLSTRGKIIWTAVFYVCFGMLRTAIEIPSGALINAVTDQPSERNKMITAYTVVMGIFTTISTTFALALVSFFGGENTAKGYMIIMAIAGIIMTVSCWCCFATTQEKFVPEADPRPLLQGVRELFHIKGFVPVLIIWLASFIAFQSMMSSSVYYVMYVLCRPDLIAPYMLTLSLVGVIGVGFGITLLMKIFKNSMKAYVISQCFVLVSNVICFVAMHNVTAVFILSGVATFFATMSMAFNSMLMTEMTDIVYRRNNALMNGTMAALKGFSNKCGSAIASSLIAFILGATGYIAGAIGQQPETTITGISSVRFIIPAAMAVVVLIAGKFFSKTESADQRAS